MLKGKINIGRRNSSSRDSDYMAITIKDNESRVSFIEIEMSMENFALAISGLSQVACEFKTTNLDLVGKKKESKCFEFEMPSGAHYSHKEAAREEAARLAPEGWDIDLYFGSQTSFFTVDDKKWARTQIFRYIENPTETG